MGLRNIIKSNKLVYNSVHLLYDGIRYAQYGLGFLVLRVLPLKNKVAASAFNGKKYGDNTKFILEQIHENSPETELIWFCEPGADYEVPPFVKKVSCSPDRHTLKRIYHYCTARVWLDTHLYEKYLFKRKEQLVIQTWHGGLGIKKIEGDVEKFNTNRFQVKKIMKNSRLADIFTSNCNFLSEIYRRAFFFKGLVWNAGFPKNDLLVCDCGPYRKKVHEWFGIDDDVNIIVYAPTYRGIFEDNGKISLTPYNIDLNKTVSLMEKYFGGKWAALVRWHPSMAEAMAEYRSYYSEKVIDGSAYPEMQEIIAASDAFISDYSSCIFDAALKNIPCFIYANDFDEYLGDRGSYFKLKELPFPCASDMDEFEAAVRDFDSASSAEKWAEFCASTGLRENGSAARSIGSLASDYLKGTVTDVSGAIPDEEKYPLLSND